MSEQKGQVNPNMEDALSTTYEQLIKQKNDIIIQQKKTIDQYKKTVNDLQYEIKMYVGIKDKDDAKYSSLEAQFKKATYRMEQMGKALRECGVDWNFNGDELTIVKREH